MQQRTVSIKLKTTDEQNIALIQLQKTFNNACNQIVPVAAENRCWNRLALHHLVYYNIRQATGLGAQMVCNATKVVCDAIKVLKIKKDENIPPISFKPHSSIHFDKRTYSLKDGAISLYTLSGRALIPMVLGQFQQQYLERGVSKEAELVCKNGIWFFNLVLDVPDAKPVAPSRKVLGVDLGENVLAATSSGKLFGGGQLRYERDRALALRSQLQSNGSESAKQLLKKISGKEARHMTHVNHEISKAIVKQALDSGCDMVAMEDLTNIRKRIRAGKRVRSRLHRWAWAQLQAFIEYKALAAGLRVVFVNPAYTSKMCADCGQIGTRNKHRFVCKICGIQRHSDLNASCNIRRIAVSADTATGTVNYPYVAAA
jgi:IS605 OrfB family transposase